MKRHPSEVTVLRRNGYCHNHGGMPCPKVRYQAYRDEEPEPSAFTVALAGAFAAPVLFTLLFAWFLLGPVPR